MEKEAKISTNRNFESALTKRIEGEDGKFACIRTFSCPGAGEM